MCKLEEELQRALKKIAHYLSFRSHSEKELKQKLSKNFSSLLIEKSLKLAKEKKWLEEPLELSEKTAQMLHKKNKSWTYIKAYLRDKELPLPSYNREKELEKAEALLNKLLREESKKTHLQLKRFLANRGFEIGIVETVLKEFDFENN